MITLGSVLFQWWAPSILLIDMKKYELSFETFNLDRVKPGNTEDI